MGRKKSVVKDQVAEAPATAPAVETASEAPATAPAPIAEAPAAEVNSESPAPESLTYEITNRTSSRVVIPYCGVELRSGESCKTTFRSPKELSRCESIGKQLASLNGGTIEFKKL